VTGDLKGVVVFVSAPAVERPTWRRAVVYAVADTEPPHVVAELFAEETLLAVLRAILTVVVPVTGVQVAWRGAAETLPVVALPNVVHRLLGIVRTMVRR
jgi:hypothetical protein